MQMLGRNKALENSLKTWEEKQRQSIAAPSKPRASISHDRGRHSATRQSMPTHEKSFLGVNIEKIRQHSFSGPMPVHEKAPPIVSFIEKPTAVHEPDILFSEEEHYLLINFIECTTTLVKWIKILAISHSLEVDLYTLAMRADTSLEQIHPSGKLLTGPRLREAFTKLVTNVKQLYEESCDLLHDRGDRLKLRDDLENKLSASLANMEMELRKCVMYETAAGSLVFLQQIQEDQVSVFHLSFSLSFTFLRCLPCSSYFPTKTYFVCCYVCFYSRFSFLLFCLLLSYLFFIVACSIFLVSFFCQYLYFL